VALELLAVSSADDSAYAWAYVLAIPSAWLSLALYIPAGIIMIYAGFRRTLKLGPILLGLILPPLLTFAMVECRNVPGWLFLLAVSALPLSCAWLLWLGLTAGRRARAQSDVRSDR